MKNKLLFTVLLIVSLAFSLFSMSASADDGKLIDWSQYDLEQLLVIQEELSEEIYNRKVEFAKENGNRIIDLGSTEINLFVGKTYLPEISIERVLDDAPETTRLLWTSSDDTIATVDANGRILGISEGNVKISCSAEDDEFVQASIDVNVVLPVEKVTITESLEMLISDDDASPVKKQLEFLVEPDNAFDRTLFWSSDNETIVTVDQNGMVTALEPGTAKVTASSMDGYSERPVVAICTVTVRKSVSAIELEAEKLEVSKNSSKKIEYIVLPEDATKKDVTWESSDPEIVSVTSNGQISARACGDATITCSSTDGSEVYSTIQITVVQKVTGLRWKDTAPIQLNVGKSSTLDVIISPEDATDKSLLWESNNKKVIQVSNSGKISAVGCGTATVSCTAADGSEKTITRDIFVPSISIGSTEFTVTSKKGIEIPFNFYGNWNDFSWTQSNGYLFDSTIEYTGTSAKIIISPNKAGQATITLSDKNSPKSRTNIKVIVDHSAAYDTVSYPRGNYEDILRNPFSYNGDQISIYGKVLQKQTSWGSTVLRVGTGGYGYYDKVFYITYSSRDVDINVIEDDMITIYGKCSGTKTYTTVLGSSITIPSIEAEKIILGNN